MLTLWSKYENRRSYFPSLPFTLELWTPERHVYLLLHCPFSLELWAPERTYLSSWMLLFGVIGGSLMSHLLRLIGGIVLLLQPFGQFGMSEINGFLKPNHPQSWSSEVGFLRWCSFGKLTSQYTNVGRHLSALLSVNFGLLCCISFLFVTCLLYTSPSPRDRQKSRMPSSA